MDALWEAVGDSDYEVLRHALGDSRDSNSRSNQISAGKSTGTSTRRRWTLSQPGASLPTPSRTASEPNGTSSNLTSMGEVKKNSDNIETINIIPKPPMMKSKKIFARQLHTMKISSYLNMYNYLNTRKFQ